MNWLKRLVGCKEESLQAQIDNLNSQIESLKAQISKMSIQPVLVQPSILGKISMAEVNAILSSQTNVIFISDETFQTTSQDQASKFTDSTRVAYRKWVEEDHDCDNFSFALMGYWSDELKSFPFGIAWSENHAFNFMIDSNKQLWIIEPQTNEWTKIEQVTNPIYKNWRFAMC